MPRSRHKAQSNVILAAIFLAVFTIAIIPLVIFMIQAGQTPPSENPLVLILQGARIIRGEIRGVYDENTMGLLLVNNAGEDVGVDRVVIQLLCGNNTQIVSVSGANIASGKIPSGGSTSLNISQYIPAACTDPTIKTIQVVSQTGAVIPVRVVSLKELLSQPTGPGNQTTTPIATPITVFPSPVGPGDELTNITWVFFRGDFDVIVDPDRSMTGGWQQGDGYRWVWKLDRVINNQAIKIDGQYIRNIWIGYDPRNTSRYNILITADNITFSTPYYSTSSHVRVKIIGFTPFTSYIMRLGTKYIYKPPESIANLYYTFNFKVDIFLNGRAEKVEIYVRAPETTAGRNATGYEPYILYMNTKPNQGATGLLFTDIDRLYGNKTTVNEYYNVTNYTRYGELRDYSLHPLVLVYTGYEVKNDELSGVILALNYQFIDNEGSDQDGVTSNEPIMILGLVELVEENGEYYYYIYTYRTYNFWELTRYEDTYPPASQMQSSIVFFPLPDSSSGNRTFYVFLLIQDPYWYNRSQPTMDDLDFALYIESLVLIPVRR